MLLIVYCSFLAKSTKSQSNKGHSECQDQPHFNMFKLLYNKITQLMSLWFKAHFYQIHMSLLHHLLLPKRDSKLNAFHQNKRLLLAHVDCNTDLPVEY